MTYMDPPRVPANNLRAERWDDQPEPCRLRLILTNIGAVTVNVIDRRGDFHQLQFGPGGESPRTLAALQALAIEMMRDSVDPKYDQF